LPSHTRPDRLRSLAQHMTDPAQKVLARGLARLTDLDERRHAVPPGPERDRLDDEIAEQSHQILHPSDADDDREAG
jgi:hypothetical protein